MKRITPALAVLCLFLPASVATREAVAAPASAFTDPDAIDAAVAAFTGAQAGDVGGAIRPVDRRLRLAPCRQALAVDWHGPAGAPPASAFPASASPVGALRRDTLVVRCPDVGGWRIFVPVRGEAGSAPTAPAVLRGEAPTVTVAGAGFAVSQAGEALDAGPVGAWIRVRVSGKSEPLRAKVIRPGLVSVEVP